MLQLQCPKCGSDNTQKLSLAVEGGTVTNRATMLGMGTTGRGGALLAGSSSGSSQSQLAQKHAAPTKVPAVRGFIAIMIVAGVAALLFGAVAIHIGFVIGVFAAVRGIIYNVKRYPGILASWDAKYICLRCSDVFAPRQQAEVIAAALPPACF
tara:strand:+ start:1288 stop:1746 length:459 start_codon:yes stop_codon:yes gene_type:complete